MQEIHIARINELARIAKERELTREEAEERARLRKAYLENFRQSFRGTLDNTVVKTEDGSKVPLREYNNRS